MAAFTATAAGDTLAGRLMADLRADLNKGHFVRTDEFDIDMIRCIYCGMCEEVCPEQAIYLRKDYLITGLKRADMLHDKKKLYEIGGVRTGLVNKWNELK